ncbi:MAG: hypothetical protein ACR2PL_00885 [Dehalococcoidia bacterium]
MRKESIALLLGGSITLVAAVVFISKATTGPAAIAQRAQTHPAPSPGPEASGAPYPTPFIVFTPPRNGTPVTLSAAEDAQMKSVVAKDPRMRQLIGSQSYQIKSSGPWEYLDGKGGVIKAGAYVEVLLAQPISIPASFDWPVRVEDDPQLAARDPSHPYRESVQHLAVDRVNQLGLMIDLKHGRVVDLSAGFRSPPTAP